MPEGVRGRRRCRRQQLVGAVLAAAAVAAGSAAPVTADSGPLLLARILPRTREARASTAALAEGLCGGSLVHEDWVLTAAQCAHESLVGAAVVRLGDEDRAVQKVVAHPEYHDGDDEAHDIALIELGPSVVAQTAPAVTLVNIMDPGLESVNSTLSLVGSEDAAAVVTAERCADEAADRMCASGPSADLVGAPLLNVASDKGRPPLQVGIATSCASRGAHAALNEYTRVRSYVKWIQSAAQIRLASLLDVEVQRQRELQFIDTNTPYPTTSQSSGSSSVEEDDAGDSPTAYPTPAPPPTSRPTEAPTPKSTPKPTEAPTTAKPTPFPTMSPTPKPTAAPTATPTVVVAMSTPAPTFYTTDLNPFDCYIFEGNPGYEKDLQGCQLPFQYKGWQGETLDFDYPPTIAEARPFGVDQLAGVAAGDTTMRWCPTVGVLTYNVDKKNRKVKWGVVYCGKPQFLPTPEPTPAPTKLPTAKPTERPTRKPTQRPTNKPTAKPTNAPTAKPTKSPTRAPTPRPTEAPTPAPTTEEFHVRDLFCMTFGTDIDDCSDGDWHDNQCTWLEGVCRARVMPTARPTMTPTQAPTSPDVVSGSAGNGDASGEDGVDMSTIIIIAGSLAGVTVIVLAVSLTMVRKRRRAGKSDPSVAMTAFTGTSGDGPYSGGNQYPGARQYPGGSQYPGGAPPPSSRPSPAAMVGNVPSYLSDFGARASTRMGNLRGFFSSSASTPSEAPSYQVSTPQSVQAGSANPHPAFRRYDTYDSYESEMAPPPPPPTPAMPSGPSRGFAAGAPGSGMDAAPPPPPPLPARPGMRPPPGLGFVNKFSSRFSRFQQ